MKNQLATFLIVGALTSGTILAAVTSLVGLGSPITIFIGAMFIAWNTWNCHAGKTMFTGSGVVEGTVDRVGRYAILFLLWVIYLCLLVEQTWLVFSQAMTS